MRYRKGLKIVIRAGIVFIILLLILTAVESKAQGSMIKSVWDALWYFIITITTVGYGDMSPVTTAGKIIGVIFALCSVGLLTAIITYCISLIGDDIFPRYRLHRSRKCKWYWFSSFSPDSEALAEDIIKEEPGSLVIFPGSAGIRRRHILTLDIDPEELIRMRQSTEGLELFYTGDNQWDNVSNAISACTLGAPVYCLSDYAEDDIPDNLRLFSRFDALGRSYWKEYPLTKDEHCVAIIGCSTAGSAILKRALLTNVYDRTRTIEYHIFGEHREFRALHPEITKALMTKRSDEDSLAFHDEGWTDKPELLSIADRIIICTDDDTVNLNIYSQLRQWFPVTADIHVHLKRKVAGIVSFGSDEEIMKPEYVMKDAVDMMAVIINDIYNENSKNPVAWRDLGEFMRQSNIAAADHLPVKIEWLLGENNWEISPQNCRRAYERFINLNNEELEACREMEHRRWMRFYWMYNWKAAETRNNALRLHPDLVPYDQLSEDEHRKDDFAWEMIGRIAGNIEELSAGK